MGLLPTHLIADRKRIVDMIAQRHEALSDNVANMHTIGYRRKDVDFSQYLANGTSSGFENKIIDKYGASPVATNASAGENRSAEDELSLIQENYMYYNVAVRQLSTTVSQIKTALSVSANS